jgi:hypothetical protein
MFNLLLLSFNPVSAWSGVTVPVAEIFVSTFYSGECASGSGDHLSKLCHKCMTDVSKRLIWYKVTI